MITTIRPYAVQDRQNFKQKIPQEFIEGCQKGNADYMNRIMDGFPHRYTIEENQDSIRKIFEDPKVKMKINSDPALRQIGKCFGIIKD